MIEGASTIGNQDRHTGHLAQAATRNQMRILLSVNIRLLVACLDTGCVMTIIDADLAKSLGLPLQKCTPVPVAGIGSRHLSSAFVSFDTFFRGADNAACIRIEAHLCEDDE